VFPGSSSSSCIDRIEARNESIQPSPVNSSETAAISPMVPACATSASMSIRSPIPGRFAEQRADDRRGQHDQREQRQEPEETRCPGQPVAAPVAVPLPGAPELGPAETSPHLLDPHTSPVPECRKPSLPRGTTVAGATRRRRRVRIG
jgi:hypothetical protein